VVVVLTGPVMHWIAPCRSQAGGIGAVAARAFVPSVEKVGLWHRAIVLASQLADDLQRRIRADEWQQGPMPSIRHLQQEYDLGRDTVVRALRILVDRGLVVIYPQRGTWVRK
jgi:DNA-binding transcriptional ArsR family regulator